MIQPNSFGYVHMEMKISLTWFLNSHKLKIWYAITLNMSSKSVLSGAFSTLKCMMHSRTRETRSYEIGAIVRCSSWKGQLNSETNDQGFSAVSARLKFKCVSRISRATSLLYRMSFTSSSLHDTHNELDGTWWVSHGDLNDFFYSFHVPFTQLHHSISKSIRFHLKWIKAALGLLFRIAIKMLSVLISQTVL